MSILNNTNDLLVNSIEAQAKKPVRGNALRKLLSRSLPFAALAVGLMAGTASKVWAIEVKDKDSSTISGGNEELENTGGVFTLNTNGFTANKYKGIGSNQIKIYAKHGANGDLQFGTGTMDLTGDLNLTGTSIVVDISQLGKNGGSFDLIKADGTITGTVNSGTKTYVGVIVENGVGGSPVTSMAEVVGNRLRVTLGGTGASYNLATTTVADQKFNGFAALTGAGKMIVSDAVTLGGQSNSAKGQYSGAIQVLPNATLTVSTSGAQGSGAITLDYGSTLASGIADVTIASAINAGTLGSDTALRTLDGSKRLILTGAVAGSFSTVGQVAFNGAAAPANTTSITVQGASIVSFGQAAVATKLILNSGSTVTGVNSNKSTGINANGIVNTLSGVIELVYIDGADSTITGGADDAFGVSNGIVVSSKITGNNPLKFEGFVKLSSSSVALVSLGIAGGSRVQVTNAAALSGVSSLHNDGILDLTQLAATSDGTVTVTTGTGKDAKTTKLTAGTNALVLNSYQGNTGSVIIVGGSKVGAAVALTKATDGSKDYPAEAANTAASGNTPAVFIPRHLVQTLLVTGSYNFDETTFKIAPVSGGFRVGEKIVVAILGVNSSNTGLKTEVKASPLYSSGTMTGVTFTGKLNPWVKDTMIAGSIILTAGSNSPAPVPQVGSLPQAFSATNAYKVGDLVTDGGKTFVALKAVAASSTVPVGGTNWSEVTAAASLTTGLTKDKFYSNGGFIYKATAANAATLFSRPATPAQIGSALTTTFGAANAYAVGDIVVDANGNAFVAKVAVAANSATPTPTVGANWDAATAVQLLPLLSKSDKTKVTVLDDNANLLLTTAPVQLNNGSVLSGNLTVAQAPRDVAGKVVSAAIANAINLTASSASAIRGGAAGLTINGTVTGATGATLVIDQGMITVGAGAKLVTIENLTVTNATLVLSNTSVTDVTNLTVGAGATVTHTANNLRTSTAGTGAGASHKAATNQAATGTIILAGGTWNLNAAMTAYKPTPVVESSPSGKPTGGIAGGLASTVNLAAGTSSVITTGTGVTLDLNFVTTGTGTVQVGDGKTASRVNFRATGNTGTWRLAKGSTFGNLQGGTFANGATVTLDEANLIFGASTQGAGNSVFATNLNLLNGKTSTITGASATANVDLTGVISGAGNLSLKTGNFALTGVNTFAGEISVAAGANLSITGSTDYKNKITLASGVVLSTAGVFKLDKAGSLVFNGAATLDASTGTGMTIDGLVSGGIAKVDAVAKTATVEAKPAIPATVLTVKGNVTLTNSNVMFVSDVSVANKGNLTLSNSQALGVDTRNTLTLNVGQAIGAVVAGNVTPLATLPTKPTAPIEPAKDATAAVKAKYATDNAAYKAALAVYNATARRDAVRDNPKVETVTTLTDGLTTGGQLLINRDVIANTQATTNLLATELAGKTFADFAGTIVLAGHSVADVLSGDGSLGFMKNGMKLTRTYTQNNGGFTQVTGAVSIGGMAKFANLKLAVGSSLELTNATATSLSAVKDNAGAGSAIVYTPSNGTTTLITITSPTVGLQTTVNSKAKALDAAEKKPLAGTTYTQAMKTADVAKATTAVTAAVTDLTTGVSQQPKTDLSGLSFQIRAIPGGLNIGDGKTIQLLKWTGGRGSLSALPGSWKNLDGSDLTTGISGTTGAVIANADSLLVVANNIAFQDFITSYGGVNGFKTTTMSNANKSLSLTAQVSFKFNKSTATAAGTGSALAGDLTELNISLVFVNGAKDTTDNVVGKPTYVLNASTGTAAVTSPKLGFGYGNIWSISRVATLDHTVMATRTTVTTGTGAAATTVVTDTTPTGDQLAYNADYKGLNTTTTTTPSGTVASPVSTVVIATTSMIQKASAVTVGSTAATDDLILKGLAIIDINGNAVTFNSKITGGSNESLTLTDSGTAKATADKFLAANPYASDEYAKLLNGNRGSFTFGGDSIKPANGGTAATFAGTLTNNAVMNVTSGISVGVIAGTGTFLFTGATAANKITVTGSSSGTGGTLKDATIRWKSSAGTNDDGDAYTVLTSTNGLQVGTPKLEVENSGGTQNYLTGRYVSLAYDSDRKNLTISNKAISTVVAGTAAGATATNSVSGGVLDLSGQGANGSFVTSFDAGTNGMLVVNLIAGTNAVAGVGNAAGTPATAITATKLTIVKDSGVVNVSNLTVRIANISDLLGGTIAGIKPTVHTPRVTGGEAIVLADISRTANANASEWAYFGDNTKNIIIASNAKSMNSQLYVVMTNQSAANGAYDQIVLRAVLGDTKLGTGSAEQSFKGSRTGTGWVDYKNDTVGSAKITTVTITDLVNSVFKDESVAWASVGVDNTNVFINGKASQLPAKVGTANNTNLNTGTLNGSATATLLTKAALETLDLAGKVTLDGSTAFEINSNLTSSANQTFVQGTVTLSGSSVHTGPNMVSFIANGALESAKGSGTLNLGNHGTKTQAVTVAPSDVKIDMLDTTQEGTLNVGLAGTGSATRLFATATIKGTDGKGASTPEVKTGSVVTRKAAAAPGKLTINVAGGSRLDIILGASDKGKGFGTINLSRSDVKSAATEKAAVPQVGEMGKPGYKPAVAAVVGTAALDAAGATLNITSTVATSIDILNNNAGISIPGANNAAATVVGNTVTVNQAAGVSTSITKTLLNDALSTFNLSGAGGLTVGTSTAGANGAAPTLAGTLTNKGTLTLGSSGTVTINAAVTNTGKFTQSGGTATYNGAVTNTTATGIMEFTATETTSFKTLTNGSAATAVIAASAALPNITIGNATATTVSIASLIVHPGTVYIGRDASAAGVSPAVTILSTNVTVTRSTAAVSLPEDGLKRVVGRYVGSIVIGGNSTLTINNTNAFPAGSATTPAAQTDSVGSVTVKGNSTFKITSLNSTTTVNGAAAVSAAGAVAAANGKPAAGAITAKDAVNALTVDALGKVELGAADGTKTGRIVFSGNVVNNGIAIVHNNSAENGGANANPTGAATAVGAFVKVTGNLTLGATSNLDIRGNLETARLTTTAGATIIFNPTLKAADGAGTGEIINADIAKAANGMANASKYAIGATPFINVTGTTAADKVDLTGVVVKVRAITGAQAAGVANAAAKNYQFIAIRSAAGFKFGTSNTGTIVAHSPATMGGATVTYLLKDDAGAVAADGAGAAAKVAKNLIVQMAYTAGTSIAATTASASTVTDTDVAKSPAQGLRLGLSVDHGAVDGANGLNLSSLSGNYQSFVALTDKVTDKAGADLAKTILVHGETATTAMKMVMINADQDQFNTLIHQFSGSQNIANFNAAANISNMVSDGMNRRLSAIQSGGNQGEMATPSFNLASGTNKVSDLYGNLSSLGLASSSVDNANLGPWVRVTHSGSTLANTAVNNFSGGQDSFQAGFDTKVNKNFTLGFSTAYSDATSAAKGETPTTASFRNLSVGTYGAWSQGRLGIDMQAGMNRGTAKTSRYVTNGLHEAFSAHVDDNNLSGNATGSYGFVGVNTAARVGYEVGQKSGLSFRPYVGMDYARTVTDSYQEEGQARWANLQVPSMSNEKAHATIGFDARSSFKTDEGTITPRVSLGWKHLVTSADTSETFALVEDQAVKFNTNGTKIDRDAALVGAGIDIRMNNGFAMYGDYNNTISAETGHQTQSLILGGKFGF
ncbi:MAG: autotransporter outer membrane beta-barrel domain-containing protein [Candidatus Pacebacteria bacterium]|nr:autotransporter outer membrane beta-barrel domain-containing protein [Candidatus Paceibacterota bacterium]